MTRILGPLLCAALSWACGPSSDPAPDDAGPADASDASSDFAPEPPVAPEAPRATPCPAGWREVSDPDAPGVVACDPWPAEGPVDCTGDEAHFPGEPGCARVGPICPAGDWAEDLPDDESVVFVRPGGKGGDGTRLAPFATVADAMAAADDGAVIALSRGVYDETVMVRRPLTLWGACVAETVIAPSTNGERAALTLTARGGATIRNIQLGGERSGIEVDDASGAIEIQAIVVNRTLRSGVFVHGTATLSARDLVVRDTRPDAAGELGLGIQVSAGARVELHHAAFERNHAIGINVIDAGSSLLAEDFAVRDTRVRVSAQDHGFGLELRDTEARLERGAFRGNVGTAISVHEDGATLLASRLAIQDTAGGATPAETGVGIGAGTSEDVGAFDLRVEVSGCLIERNRHAGIMVAGPGASIAVTDVLIRDTLPWEIDDSFSGLGVLAFEGARIEIERTVIARTTYVGILASGAGTSIVATDARVVETREQSDGLFGIGVGVVQGARAELHRAAIERSRPVGVFVADPGSTIEGDDVRIGQTLGDAVDGHFGFGLDVEEGAAVTLKRLAVQQARAVGIGAWDTETLVTLEDFSVRETLEQACAAGSCPEAGVGSGIVSIDGASVVANRFVSTSNDFCGVQLSRSGTMDLHDGEVSANPIGACVQDGDFDVARLQDGVRYRDNDRTLAADRLPVPDGLGGL